MTTILRAGGSATGPASVRIRLWRPLAASAAVIVLLTGVALGASWRSHLSEQEARLEAIAGLRAQQVGEWLAARLDHGRHVSANASWAQRAQQWQRSGDGAALASLWADAIALRKTFAFTGVLLLGADGATVAAEHAGDAADGATPALGDAARRALAGGEVLHTAPRQAPGGDATGFDIVAPLAGAGLPAPMAVVLHVDVDGFIARTLRSWPVPTRSGTVRLLQRGGDTPVGLARAIATSGQDGTDRAFVATDDRGVESIVAMRAVPGTADWLVVARIDRGEVLEGHVRSTFWIGAAGVLALFGATAGLSLGVQRRVLRESLREQAAQAELLRQLAQQRETEAQYRSIVTALVEGVLVIDRDRRVLACNLAAERLLALSLDRMQRHRLALACWRLQRADGTPMPSVESPLERTFSTAQACHEVLVGISRRGRTVHWMMVNTEPVVDTGTGALSSVVVSFRDVTERVRIEAEVARHRHHLQELVDERTQRLQQMNLELARSRDQAEAATRAKSAFLANVSHEIRTPLNVILGLTHLLARDNRDAVAAERLARVDDAASQLHEIISDILDLSKIEAGRMVLEPADFSLRELVARTCAAPAERARAKGVTLNTDVAAGVDRLHGDPGRLSQAMQHLLSNAVKFTERGSIDVRCALEPTDGAAPTLRFTVSDTGVGIAADQLDRLFDAFVQGDATAARRFGGTGLGLAITRRLAELMGGQVGVTSQIGQGSTFWFTARLRPAASDDVEAAAAQDQSWLRLHQSGARVLVAVDNPVNQEVVVELLRAAGLVVELASNGAEAVAKVRHGGCELVLMDLQMPVMDGQAAARALRTLPDAARLPILGMTADPFGEVSRSAGIDALVAKPVNPGSLYPALRRWLLPRTPAPGQRPPETMHAQPPAAAVRAAAADAAVAPPDPLLAMAGVDVALALKQLGGRMQVYRRVLRQFQQHYGESLEDVGARLTGGDAAAARAAAHSIRGASASIGAQSLAALAGRVEAAATDPELAHSVLPDAGRALLTELRTVIDAIGAALGAEAPEAGRDGATLATETLDRLERLLDAGDYNAMTLYREHVSALRERFGPAAVEIGAKLRGFEFDRALALLRQLRSGPAS